MDNYSNDEERLVVINIDTSEIDMIQLDDHANVLLEDMTTEDFCRSLGYSTTNILYAFLYSPNVRQFKTNKGKLINKDYEN